MARSPLYRVVINSSSLGSVSGWLPEEFQFGVESEWDSPFDKGGGTGSQVLSAVGLSTKTTVRSSQVWSGSSPVTISMPIDFIAVNNSRNEVVRPIRTLMKMALPGGIEKFGSTFLDPPGPTIVDTIDAYKDSTSLVRGDIITVRIGRFIRFTHVVILQVQPSWSGKLSVDGLPMQAKVDIGFRTFTTLTKNQLDRMFIN